MKRNSRLLVGAIVVLQAVDSQAIVGFLGSRRSRAASLASTRRSRAALDDTLVPAAGAADPDAPVERQTLGRPHFREGIPEIVKYGIYAKGMGGINIVEGTFTADLVISLEWQDPRAASIAVDQGVESLTLPYDQAEELLWMPDVRISNRALHGVEVISSAVVVDSKGTVKKVDRVLAISRNDYVITRYPFDTQELVVALGSEALMLDELQFQPMSDPTANGLGSKVLQDSDFEVNDFKVVVEDEKDGHLHKSRGLLKVKVRRVSAPYFQSLLLPELLVLIISISVFWFPALGVFAMPRVATALISFLTLTTLGLRTNTLLPIRGGLVWIDLFELCCQALMLFSLLFNILVLVIYHTFEEEDLATRIDHELKFVFPFMAVVTFGLCFYSTDGNNLMFVSFAINNVIILGFVAYFAFALWRLRQTLQEQAKLARQEAKDQQQAMEAVQPPPLEHLQEVKKEESAAMPGRLPERAPAADQRALATDHP